MMLDRRTLLASVAGLTAWSRGLALSEDALPALVGYERETGGRIGLYAKNLSTGTNVTWRGNERFVMCSTFKASLAGLVLRRIDRRQDQLDCMISYSSNDIPDWHAPVAKQNLAKGAMSVADMCEAVVEYSDNTCANLLLARVGGPNSLTAFWRSTGDSVTRLDHNEPMLNRSRPGDPRDTTTPVAMAGTLRRLVLGGVLSPESKKKLVEISSSYGFDGWVLAVSVRQSIAKRAKLLKNIQVIDGALNSTFSVFQATDSEFALIFSLKDQDIQYSEDLYELPNARLSRQKRN